MRASFLGPSPLEKGGCFPFVPELAGHSIGVLDLPASELVAHSFCQVNSPLQWAFCKHDTHARRCNLDNAVHIRMCVYLCIYIYI